MVLFTASLRKYSAMRLFLFTVNRRAKENKKRTPSRVWRLKIHRKILPKKELLMLFRTTRWVCKPHHQARRHGAAIGLSRGDGKHGTCGPQEGRPERGVKPSLGILSNGDAICQQQYFGPCWRNEEYQLDLVPWTCHSCRQAWLQPRSALACLHTC